MTKAKTRDKWAFVEWRDKGGQYHGVNYRESYLPHLYESLQAKGIAKVWLNEAEISLESKEGGSRV